MIRRGAVLERRLLDGVLLAHAHGDAAPLRLNGTAASIWFASAEPATADAIAERVAAAYGVATADIASEVAGALGELVSAGVLVDD